VDYAIEGKKPLGLHSRFESTHLPFPLARRLMRRPPFDCWRNAQSYQKTGLSLLAEFLMPETPI
jgi:hypothetical protein